MNRRLLANTDGVSRRIGMAQGCADFMGDVGNDIRCVMASDTGRRRGTGNP